MTRMHVADRGAAREGKPLVNNVSIRDSAGTGQMFDMGEVKALLVEAAREGRAVSYAEALACLGWRFTRPRMRALCKALDAVDAAGAAAGEPELAVLVVRESDGLPGQGWWVARAGFLGHDGDWTGPEAKALVRELQGAAFDYWRDR